ncbi:M20 family metallopeptidase [Muricomes intestini]|jgi:succinyl-diaminopimelate desuccinylase|uniref:Succinyl-diaminopimelate desuccinylase n=1 Tax=Muricomes intestini TaxID=1796634 RepID=A0A4R3KDP8_9FIRM|nr:M20 family metallopeptidase [Muricomes intestini]TCS81180.1 succinyl-diaminopimelate desuccinylase [Muricomes intestini]HAX52497.1 peptidase M20 [Lachnospiraceae bacterium]
MRDAVDLAARLVRIESTNPGTYEGCVGEFICQYLEEAGVKPEKSLVVPGRFNVRAILEGEVKHPALIFICHMDTVVKGNGWDVKAFEGNVTDGRLVGRGACDMKSGLASALSVFAETAEQIKRGDIKLRHSLMFIGTVDEEGDMRGVEKVIADGWVTERDWIMDTEPTDGQIQMSHKGRTWFELSAQGVTAHASMPEKGADAIAGMAEMLTYIRRKFAHCPVHPELGRSTVTFGQIQGGYSPYVVPDSCQVTIDMRLVPPMDTKQAEEILKAAIEEGRQQVPGVKGSYRITGDRPWVETHPESVLLGELKKAFEEAVGKVPKVSAFPGYTDTAVIAGRLKNKECISCGPGSLKQAHKPNEFVPTTEIVRCQEVFFILVKNMLTEERAM